MEKLKIKDEMTGEDFLPEALPSPEPIPEAPSEAPKPRRKKNRRVKPPAVPRAAQIEAGKQSGNRKGELLGRPVSKSGKPVYRVSLACKTPLAHASLEIEAQSEEEAKKEFCRQNGISDSIHPWSVVRIA